MSNYNRSKWSLISTTTKLTTVAVLLDVTALVICAALVPPSKVREPMIATVVAFVILLVLFFVSLCWDAEVICDYYEQRNIAAGAAAAVAAGYAMSLAEEAQESQETVIDRVDYEERGVLPVVTNGSWRMSDLSVYRPEKKVRRGGR